MPLAERALIAEIRRLVGRRRKSPTAPQTPIAGVGDDCAVLRPPAGKDLLVTTDFSLEGVHFRREWHPPESVGHRCLARGLSDIAAMGGEPIAVFLSLALPPDLPQSWVRRFMGSLVTLAAEYGATLAGGDTAQSSGGVLADIIVIGGVAKERAILRSGARPEDRIYISGRLGGSAAAVRAMMRHPRRKLSPRDYPRHFFPEPRIELGRKLSEKGWASAMIDTSDGLSTDLAHICEESDVGAEIDASSIPRATVGKPVREVDLDVSLHGGEDYELLFTARPGQRIPEKIAGVPIAQIGTITRSRKITMRDAKARSHTLESRGWEHFR